MAMLRERYINMRAPGVEIETQTTSPTPVYLVFHGIVSAFLKGAGPRFAARGRGGAPDGGWHGRGTQP
jgi:hypothetical protein